MRSAAGDAGARDRGAADTARLADTVIDAPLVLHAAALAEAADMVLGAGTLQLDR